MSRNIYRRMRRRTASHEAANANKESKQEQSFFGEASHETFFQPSPVIQRKCEKCEEEDKKVQRQQDKKEDEKKLQRTTDKKEEEKLQKKESADSSGSSPGVNNYVASLNGKGQSLSADANQYFSSRMGYDFSDVKIHNDKEAAQSAKEVNAKAYTVGEHVVFNAGQYNTESEEGKKLMAHELTHVMQQNNQSRLQKKEDDSAPSDKKENQDEEVKVQEAEANKNEEDITAPVSLPDITTYGRPASESAYGKSVHFDGKTDADFDGGVGQTKNLKAIPAKDCKDCSASECMTVTGSFEITYTVTTNVTLPDMPEGLTPCQQKRVKDAIDGVLAPHEQKHVKAFETYNGKVTLPITYTGCKDGLQQYLQDLNDADGIKRKAAAKAKSDALDPFFVNVDLDCVEPAPPKK